MAAMDEAVDWARGLDALVEQIAPRFCRIEPRRRVRAYLQGIIPLTKQNLGGIVPEHCERDALPAPDGTIFEDTEHGTREAYGGRGVFVPHGMTAAEIMIGASVLTERWEIQHYDARIMVRDVLEAIRQPQP